MRLLKFDDQGVLSLTEDLQDNIPPYAILSHTWADDQEEEVNFDDLQQDSFKNKAGYAKIRFCGKQARKDKLEYFWVDTCNINKANNTEYSEAINSMFRWYRDAKKCYVYLSDVSISDGDEDHTKRTWKRAFRQSRWFKRGWTLQELLAPASVEFFSQEEEYLGSKSTLEQQIHEITDIPITALRGTPLSQFSVDERMRWAAERDTKKKEDQAYCLLGIFGIFMPLIYGEGEYALIRLRHEVDKSHGSTLSTSLESSNTHWVMPRSSNTLFTGRKDILDNLEKTVRDAVQRGMHADQCRQSCIVIAGLGGQGKSEISLQLAQRVRPILWGVFWIDVSTASLAENGFLAIATRLQISASTWEGGRQGLASVQRPWMLVLDNADDPNVDYQAYFPPGLSGVVVLTSRNEECRQYATAGFVPLEGLPIEDATDLLLKAANIASEQRPLLEADARGVATLLQSHPLALIQAGAYVQRDHCTLAEYPRVYERQRERLLKFRPSQAQSRYRDVYATFEASVEILQASRTESSQDALELLPLLAMCRPNQLPLMVFEAAWGGAQGISADQSTADEDNLQLTLWHKSRLPSLIQANTDTWDPFRLVEAANALKAFALVSTKEDHGHIRVSMHPLVHAWAKDRQDAQQQRKSWIAMGCVMALSRGEYYMWQLHARQLQPHLQSITLWDWGCVFQSEPRTPVAGILTKCGRLLNDMRDDKTLFTMLNRLCTHLGLDHSSVDYRWVRLYDLIGQNFFNYGRVREAVQVLEEVVRIEGQTLTEDHPSRLRSQDHLAWVYQANGQIKEAVQLLEEVMRIRNQTLAEYHPDRLKSQHHLALVYGVNGQTKEAVQLLEEVVWIRNQTLAEDHPSRLASQHNLAFAYQENKQIKEAIQLQEKVVQIRSQTLAEDHPNRLESQHNLALLYKENGRIKEATQLLEGVVQIQKKTLAEDHPDKLVSQYNLACAYLKNGRVKEAIQLLEGVVQIQKKTLAEDHPDQILSLYALAGAYKKNGQVKAAIQLLEEVVQIRKQTLPDDHRDQLASQHDLAIAYWANEQTKEAAKLLEEVVQIQRQALPEDHQNRLNSQHQLAIMLWKFGEHSRALEMMGHVVEIHKQVLDSGHPDRIASEEWLSRFENAVSNT